MYSQDNEPFEEQSQLDDEEELNDILLQPLNQGRYTYDPKPPSQYWLEIEQRYAARQKESEQKFQNVPEEIKKWRDEMNTQHDNFLDPTIPKNPNQPNNWWYIPTEPPRPENEQLTSEESENENGDEGKTKTSKKPMLNARTEMQQD